MRKKEEKKISCAEWYKALPEINNSLKLIILT